ncbi:PREDICTED: uncharacterized protein LOC108563318 [Nicrophorus vespilloides]|uniref:Uncharacterized protein LOC108563318 n=1 Tax=Nicrophorus vespilloides TaxID=110193 RepID=A0ABM1MS97_NICVS|nr:PREDICTED: uncharacterized protein LOC108563318 [Nicrophorus vespilloides]
MELPESKQDEAEEVKKRTFWKMSAGEKFKHLREVITVEPMLALYIIATAICITSIYSLEIEKGCKADGNFTDEVCDAILEGMVKNYTTEYKKVQVVITDMKTWNTPFQSAVPIILVIFLGSYSDRHKVRKPLMIIPIIGEVFACISLLISVFFMRELPLWVNGICQTVIPSFFGGQPILIMALYTYIADISTMEMRTVRIGIVQIVLSVSVPLAQSLSGILYEFVGYYGVFTLALILYACAVLYGIFFIKEKRESKLEFKKDCLVDMFNPTHVLQTLNLLVKKSPNFNRTNIILLMTVSFLISGYLSGEGSLANLYFLETFSLTSVGFGYFLTVNFCVHLAGVIVGVPLFTKLLKFTDYGIIIFSIVDKMITVVIYALVKTMTAIYIGTAVSFFISLYVVGMRSLATKVVTDDDLGKAQSLFTLCETLGAVIILPIFTKSYQYTLEYFPASFFLMGFCMYLVCLVIIIFMYIMNRKESAAPKDEEKSNQMQMSENVGKGYENSGLELDENNMTHI